MSFQILKNWVQENEPALNKTLGPMTYLQILAHLNNVTGLDVASSENIDRTALLFLKALQTMKEKA